MNNNDITINEYLNNFNNYKLTSKNAEKLLCYNINEKSLFYWYNATLPDNLLMHNKNIHFLENLKTKDTLLGTLFYIYSNLPNILDRLELSDNTLYLPLEYVHKQKTDDVKIISLTNTYNNRDMDIDIEFDTNITSVQNIIPINKPKEIVLLSKILDICENKVYYPIDQLEFPIQRAVLYNLFQKNGIPLNTDQEFVNETIINNIICFIDTLPSGVDIDLVKTFYNLSIPSNNNVYSTILMVCLSTYMRIGNETPKTYRSHLERFEGSILNSIAKKIGFDYDVLMNEIESKEINYAYRTLTCVRPQYCDTDSVSETTIFKLLSNYKNLFEKSVVLADLNLCPIHVKYITTVFPYYQNHCISHNIETNILQFNKMEDLEKAQQNTIFKRIKKIVSFNNDYETFKNTIELINISPDDVIKLMPLIYENFGFKCSTVLAVLANYHLNMTFDTRTMYMLISKLSTKYQLMLENETLCKIEYNNSNVFNIVISLLDVSLPMINLNTTTIECVIDDMKTQSIITDKILIASTSRFNILSLINVMKKKDYKSFEDAKELFMLMLYSNLSIKHKALIYSLFPKNIEFPTKDAPPKQQAIKNMDYDFKSLLAQFYKNNNCSSVLDYYKTTKDANSLQFILNNNDSLESNYEDI